MAAPPKTGRQQTAFAFYRRVGVGHVGGVHDRYAGEFQPRVFVLNFLVDAIVDDAHRLQLPQQGPGRVRFAWFARGINGAVQRQGFIVDQLGVFRGEPRTIRHDGPEIFDQPVFKIPRHFHGLRKQHFAGGVVQRDVAGGANEVLALVVADGVGQQRASALIDFDVAARGDDAQFLVVGHFVG